MDQVYYCWTKGEEKPLGEHFKSHEFNCPCKNEDCTDQKIAIALVQKLNILRDKIGRSIEITSGYRCHKHQEELKAQGNETAVGISQHELGNAADLASPAFEWLMIQAPFQFKAIGYAKKWIHVDLRDDKPRKWYYKN